MKKVMWFSRHEMSAEQSVDLVRIFGEIEVTQINKTINTGFDLKDEIETHDVIAIVAPINIQEQILRIAKDKPVITAMSERILVKNEDGSEDKVVFKFKNWTRIKKIVVETEVL
jgi:hypothetical protein